MKRKARKEDGTKKGKLSGEGRKGRLSECKEKMQSEDRESDNRKKRSKTD